MQNRIEINPLIEENMNQMVDGELAINQINGHITIKNGEKYVSKTKKLNIEIIDKENLKEDLVPKIEEDENQLAVYKQQNTEIENVNASIEAKLDAMLKVIETYEDKCNYYDNKLKSLDTSLKNQLHNAQININTAINNNIQLLGSLMIENELMDRIADNKDYYDTYVKNHWNYPNKSDVVNNYNTETQHENNKVEMDKRVTKAEYDTFVAQIEKKYSDVGAVYKIKGGI